MYKEFKRVRLGDDLTIDVLFWSGEARKYDMKGWIENSHPKAFVRELKNIELFKNPEEITYNRISWNWKYDIYWKLIYFNGIEIPAFEDGIEVKHPYVEDKMKMKRARFNDDFAIDVVFE